MRPLTICGISWLTINVASEKLRDGLRDNKKRERAVRYQRAPVRVSNRRECQKRFQSVVVLKAEVRNQVFTAQVA